MHRYSEEEIAAEEERLAWWEMRGGAIEPVDVVWEPSPALFDKIEYGG